MMAPNILVSWCMYSQAYSTNPRRISLPMVTVPLKSYEMASKSNSRIVPNNFGITTMPGRSKVGIIASKGTSYLLTKVGLVRADAFKLVARFLLRFSTIFRVVLNVLLKQTRCFIPTRCLVGSPLYA